MKLYLKTKNVLDERETQEMYRIEHRGMWGMYALLCAAVVVQMLFGAAAFILCFALLSLLMVYVKKRQKQQSDELDDE